MDFHEWDAWHLMMVNVRADGQTVAHTSDLETLPQRWESKGIGGSRTHGSHVQATAARQWQTAGYGRLDRLIQ